MHYAIKAIKWAYSDSLKAIAFFVATFLAVGAVMIVVTYPWQVLTTLVGGFILWTLFLLITEWK